MAGKKRWTDEGISKGIWTFRLFSWKYFHDFVRKEMLDYSHYVWRGDRCDNRPLIPSFDRRYKNKSQRHLERRMRAHLEAFKLAVRGRRGVNPPKLESDNDWWSLGQHQGLETPLLDWTRSPFVALFFAFENVKSPQTSCRAIYAINPLSCTNKSSEIIKTHKGADRPDIVEFFTPLQDDNSRLVNQNGLFSRCTAGKPLDVWIAEKYASEDKNGVMLKILIPNEGRQECLRTLNKMNINHLTLFPDLYGASKFVNTLDTIPDY